MPQISIIVLATGPDRVATRAIDAAVCQTAVDLELIVVHDHPAGESSERRLSVALQGRTARFVPASGLSPGAARNVAVRRSHGSSLLIIDGSEALQPDHAAEAVRAMQCAPSASFAVSAGHASFVPNETSSNGRSLLDANLLIEGPWSVGSAALVRRNVFDELGGFDESLAGLVEWEFLLRVAESGRHGVAIETAVSRYTKDDVRLREALRADRYLPALRAIFSKHQASFERRMSAAITGRERTASALWRQERRLVEARDRARAELEELAAQLSELRPAVEQRGWHTLDFGDLRRTTPVSRNWGLERGMPIDRHYIHAFIATHAADVRGDVLEMLDSELTTTYGGDRVRMCDVLDNDPGNGRATLVADLRVAEQVPPDTYDCFILTQTLHLIDDMPKALATAHKLLKPGGILLATLPTASMVAVEYGPDGDHWRVTEAGARTLFERQFEPAAVEVRGVGNVLAITTFLYGLSCEDLDPGELDAHDAAYPVLITVRAQKSFPTSVPRRLSSRPLAAILLYHRVASLEHDVHGLAVSPNAFRAQIEHLGRHWRVMPLAELARAVISGEPPERAVALTFDDGYLDNVECAAPILSACGVPATFFVTSERLGEDRNFWWDELEHMLLGSHDLPPEIEVVVDGQRSTFLTGSLDARRHSHDALYRVLKESVPARRDYLLLQLARVTSAKADPGRRPITGDEVRRLTEFPLMEIGAHTVHHLSLPHLTPDDLHREVFESRSALERVSGRPVTAFAYPYGASSPDVVRAVLSAGYDVAVGCDDRPLRGREHPLRLPRVPTREETGTELEQRLLGYMALASDL